MSNVILRHKGEETGGFGPAQDLGEVKALVEAAGWRLAGQIERRPDGMIVAPVAQAYDFEAAFFQVCTLYPNVVRDEASGHEVARCCWFPSMATEADKANAALLAQAPAMFRLLSALVAHARSNKDGALANGLLGDAETLLLNLSHPR